MSEFEKELDVKIKSGEIMKERYKTGCILSHFVNLKDIESTFKDWQPPKELVKVRQFVADWFEKNKDNLEQSIYGATVDCYNKESSEEDKFLNWLDDTETNSYETLIRMKLEGYLIDNDELYEVVFLDDGNHRLILNKAKGNRLFIDFDEDVEIYHKTEFTEKEIKAIDKRYLAFAVKVEG